MQRHIEIVQQVWHRHNDVFSSLDPPESPSTKEEPPKQTYLLATHDVERLSRS